MFCANDKLALGLIRAMHEQGKRVPGDVSVVGFDGFDVGEYSFPPLTTVRQNFKQHGRKMMGLMLRVAVLVSILRSLCRKYAVISEVAIVQIIIGRDCFPV